MLRRVVTWIVISAAVLARQSTIGRAVESRRSDPAAPPTSDLMTRLFGLAVLLSACAGAPPAAPTSTPIVADLQPTQGYSARGALTFTAVPGGTHIEGTLTGVSPGVHGLHIHESGDCSAPDASSAGGHFNPSGAPHGPPSTAKARRHVGDLGNVVAAADGTVIVQVIDPVLSTSAVIGRAVVLHSGPDDYVSQPSGDAGDRVACGVVE